MACVRPGTVTLSRAQCWLRCGCQEVPLKDANMCLIAARASRTVQPSRFCNPTRGSSQPQTQKLGGFCTHVDLHEWGCGGGEKTLGGFLSTPWDISKAIRERCLPGTPGASTVLAMMYGAQVVPIHKVKSKHLMAACCPRWILPLSQATFFMWPLRALLARRALETGTAALWPDFIRRFFAVQRL